MNDFHIIEEKLAKNYRGSSWLKKDPGKINLSRGREISVIFFLFTFSSLSESKHLVWKVKVGSPVSVSPSWQRRQHFYLSF